MTKKSIQILFFTFTLASTSMVFAKAPSKILADEVLESVVQDTSDIYDVVSEMPEIKGGIQELYKHIEYPRAALSRRVEGQVYIKFVVDENGKVLNPTIVKDIGSGCGDAAIEGIKKIKFKPGKQKGKAVKVNYTLPVRFKIEN